MLVRDEADIIAQNLKHVLGWADDVFIFDTGSTDGTWEIITNLAAREARIKPVELSSVVFGEHLRAYLFDKVRHTFEEDDWVVKLDADEFFHISPPEFVREHLLKTESCVWLQWYFFRLTSSEVADYESRRVDTVADRQCPIEGRRRFYKMPIHSEPRMFKYRDNMKWSERNSFPTHAGYAAQERVPIRHYPHRDPEQMRARYILRSAMKRLGSSAGAHWNCEDWRQDVANLRGNLEAVHETSREGLYAVKDHESGPLLYWQPGSALPVVHDESHLRASAARAVQSCFHRWLVGTADCLPKRFTREFIPPALFPGTSGGKTIAVTGPHSHARQRTTFSLGAFHGLMVVRDEDDIIEECLKHVLAWADAVYVLDLGSTDQTWNIVRETACRDSRVVPFRSELYPFNDAIRGYVFEKYRDRFRNGDWVLRLDADEFYHVAPPEFVRERMSPAETCVYMGWYYFRLTSVECEAYDSGRVDAMADRKRSIVDRRRFYKITEHAEPRMFRFRSNIKWPEKASFPNHAGLIARERIPIRHYPHRDPLQMQTRYRLRSEMVRLKAATFPHWRLDDWRKEILDYNPATLLAAERTGPGEGLSSADGHTAGPLYEWKNGEPLPRPIGSKHLGGWPKRSVQRLIHPALLPLFDRVRRGWSRGFDPPRL